MRRARQAADEVPVDLQVGERQVLQVVQRAEARAEVIECDGAAERLRARAERLRLVHIADRGGLGQLDH